MNQLPLPILNRCSKGMSISEAIEDYNKGTSNKFSLESKPESAAPEVNALGLPEGSPTDRNELKAALDKAGVEYHKKVNTKTLVEVYTSEVLETEPS